ncbi:hypothetical protein [Bacillus solitudinis]|uniref:hypothetical protein n=1 Tax=Bacillus solitudinis TaxID=2014074 RepID=UPI000C236DFA|nr:hypothetical protein [Bacillus solitudinis]
MYSYYVYGKTLLLIAAYGGTVVAINILPPLPEWTLSGIIAEFIFSPFKLLTACLGFMIGFLAYSLFIQDALRFVYSIKRNKTVVLFLVLACSSWFDLFLKSWLIALVALSLAFVYGIMDVDLRKRDK